MNTIKFDKYGLEFNLVDIISIGIRDYDVVLLLDCGSEFPLYSGNTISDVTYMAEEYTRMIIEKYRELFKSDK